MKIVGHESQRTLLLSLLHRGKLPSSMLFHGPEGIGKRQVALLLTAALFCEKKDEREILEGCMKCSSCTLLSHNNHPELFTLDLGKAEERTVERCRDLLGSLARAPVAGKARLVIIDRAEYLSLQVANTLLKTLEEPRKGSYFVLLSSSRGKVLPTINSRCHPFGFQALPSSELSTILSELLPQLSKKEREELCRLSYGSVSAALLLHQEKDLTQKVTSALDLLQKGSSQGVVTLLKESGKDKERVLLILRLLTLYIRSFLHEGTNPSFWASLLQETVWAETLIRERNLTTTSVFSHLFIQNTPSSQQQAPEYSLRSMMFR